MSGLFVQSDLPFATFPIWEDPLPAERTVRFSMATGQSPASPAWLLDRKFPDEERPWMSVGRVAEGYLLRIHGLADFLVDTRGTTIVCAPQPDCDFATIEQLFVDQILPQVLHLRGVFALHASAVAWRGGSVAAFAGVSGAGKSTLAANLSEGRGLVSDDCLAISTSAGEIIAHPSYPSARLCRDTADALWGSLRRMDRASPRTAKLRVGLPSPGGRLTLRHLYLLEQADVTATIVPLSRRDAVVGLARFVHRLDPGDRTLLAAELDFLEEIATRVPVSRLLYRHRFDELPDVRAAIDAAMDAGPGR